MKVRSIPQLLLVALMIALLSGCQDQQARQQNTELQGRVAALEKQVQALQAAQERTQAVKATSDPAQVEAQAAAQNCANELTRALETFRELSIDDRYPTPAQLELPDACQDQRVAWVTLNAQAYQFKVLSASGDELNRQSGP